VSHIALLALPDGLYVISYVLSTSPDVLMTFICSCHDIYLHFIPYTPFVIHRPFMIHPSIKHYTLCEVPHIPLWCEKKRLLATFSFLTSHKSSSLVWKPIVVYNTLTAGAGLMLGYLQGLPKSENANDFSFLKLSQINVHHLLCMYNVQWLLCMYTGFYTCKLPSVYVYY